MKAVFSLFALSGLFASALAAPVVQVEGLTATAGGLVEALPTVTLPVLSEVSVPEVAVKRDISVTEVMTKVQGLLVTVKEHTAIINATIASLEQGQDKTLVGATVKTELVTIYTVVSEVYEYVATIKVGVLTFTTVEVKAIATVLFAIIFEIVATVVAVLKVLGIQALLSGVLAQLTIVIASLVLAVEGLAAGVLVTVNSIISVSGVFATVDSVFVGLPVALATKKIVGL